MTGKKKPVILFIQGGGEGAYDADNQLNLYLRNALGNDYEIRYPRMPDENDPDYQHWKIKIDQELKEIDSRAILAGHSIGGYVLLKYLTQEKIYKHVDGIFFISTPFLGEGGWQYEDMIPEKDMDLKLPGNTPVFFYHGTDDEIVPFSHLALYAKAIPRATIRKITGVDHQLNNDLAEIVRDIESLG